MQTGFKDGCIKYGQAPTVPSMSQPSLVLHCSVCFIADTLCILTVGVKTVFILALEGRDTVLKASVHT